MSIVPSPKDHRVELDVGKVKNEIRKQKEHQHG